MSNAELELDARKAWTLARIGELVNAGRGAGWLRGDAMAAVPTADAVFAIASGGQTIGETPMAVMASRLGLSAVEMDALWLLVCIELEPMLAEAAQTLVASGMHELNIQILERLVGRAGRALDGEAIQRLVRFGLIEAVTDRRVPMYRRAVRASDRAIELARTHSDIALDRELADIATLATATDVLATTSAIAPHIPAELAHAIATVADVFAVATGVTGSGRATMVRHAIATAGHAILTVRAAALATDADPLGRQLRAIAREARLHDAWPVLLDIDTLTDRAALIERELLRVHRGPAFATARESCTWPIARALLTMPVALPDEATRTTMWRHALPTAAADVASSCARRYTIAPGLLARTATAAAALATSAHPVEVRHVHTALRGQLERRLTGLATRIETRQNWDDLVLPADQFDLLVELVGRVQNRRRVFETWGFADKIGRGLGLSALLSGPPGTGKTMIAGLVARELGLDLYQVDLARIVSKYIGETEKQLAELFDAAEAGHAMLLFDEADSLFGKRTDVKSSNDRYANLEVNYLLQRMEAFTGISILTTNHETSIDPAFMRRLAFHVRVPMPDDDHRAALWRTMIPARADRAVDLEFGALATDFVMSGGYIKNAVVRAAFFAAADNQPISTHHLQRAARAEYEAMGKVTFASAFA